MKSKEKHSCYTENEANICSKSLKRNLTYSYQQRLWPSSNCDLAQGLRGKPGIESLRPILTIETLIEFGKHYG
jgi:hypothetical protein